MNMLHDAELLNKYEEEKGPPVWQDPSATLEQDVSGNSRERSEEVSILGSKPDGEALRSITKQVV